MIDWLKFLLSISLSGTIMFGFWLLGRYIFRRFFTKRYHYFMLFIVLLRFVVPISAYNSLLGELFYKIESTVVYTYIFAEKEAASEDNLVVVEAPKANTFSDQVSVESNREKIKQQNLVAFVLLNVWLVGFLLFFIRRIIKYRRFLKYVRSIWQPVNDSRVLELVSTICKERNIRQPLAVYETPLIASPFLVGLWKSCIVLPHTNLTTAQLNNVLVHEITHYQKKDIWYKWFAQLVVCLHWFNPVVHIIEKVVNFECELACDEKVVKYLSKEEKKRYGLTLIEMTKISGKYKVQPVTVSLYKNKNELKRRLESMKTYRLPTDLTKTSGGIVFLIFLLIAIKVGVYGLWL